MKHFALILLALFAVVVASSPLSAQTEASLATDKTMYDRGETIVFTGAEWAPGEPVTIAFGSEGSDEQITLQTVADSSGAFTVTATMPDSESVSARATETSSAQKRSGRKISADASENANFHATAKGGISKKEATAEFSEGDFEPDGARLLQLETYWHERLTSPTGKFNPGWVRQAAEADKKVPRGTPKGKKRGQGQGNGNGNHSVVGLGEDAVRLDPLALNEEFFTALGPRPQRMTGCSGCFDYTTTQGRVNTIAIDPTTTTNGSIVAYIGTVGGGVWKTTNCCSAIGSATPTTWTVMTDDPLISTTTIDTLTLDPNDHNTIYAGTGDLNYGSFSMGSQGILKSTDGGAHWTVLGADVFGAEFPQVNPQFPQYQAVGKVRVDPNNSNNVVAGTKTGLYFSYDAGANWTGPCLTNTFTSMRQDITGLELSNMGSGVTRILAAIGVRGFATTVQFNLNQNGANGLYSATMQPSGCPSFTSIATNANGFRFGTTVTGSPYATNANMNAGSGSIWVNATTGNQLGRMDIAVAPSNPNVIYAQVQSIAPNNNSGCGNTNGCQLGIWASADGGANWSFMTGSAGGSLRNCAGGNTSGNPGDYPQNWYDQGMAVDPNNPDRLFVDTYDTWFATRTGTALFNQTCGYNGSAASAHVVHVDHHTLAFVPGSSSILLEGSDGGIFATLNANLASSSARATWINMDAGLNTIEFYSGDISGNFASSPNPSAVGGAQDNAPSVAGFPPNPTGPVQWQTTVGGDGFYARIDPVGTGTSPRYWVGNNSGGLSRCTSNCLAGGSGYGGRTGGWSGDTQSFILPFDLFHGGIPGGDDCGPAGATTGCGHLIAGTTRVWETITGATTTNTWIVTNNPSTQNMTKGTLGNRSFINQVKYSPKWQRSAIVGTNDANVWIGFNLGTGVAGQANWVNVTGGNTVLPLRPVLGIALDPTTTLNMPIGYAAVGGFNGNSILPGHIFRVVCTSANCGSFTWSDKTGNLPDIPVDSIIVNPNFAQQVFAGTDFGLYYTDDINALPQPTWQRFSNGLPAVMIWDMQIDRGATTLSLWTRGRGAYAWPLSIGPENPLPSALTLGDASGVYGGTVDLTATLTSSGNPVPGQTITFSLNGHGVGEAMTDSNGVAALSGASLAGINAGNGSITASLEANTNYEGATASATLTVDKKPIVVSAVSDTKTYDQATTSNASPTITPGLVGSDTSGFIQTFDTRQAGTDKTLTPSGSANDGNNGDNYSVTFVANTHGEITAKELTGSITAESKVYDGTTDATIATRSLSGVIAPDEVFYVGGTATFSDKTVGDGKTVTATGLGLSGTDAGNYFVNDTATTAADITARELHITATGISKLYDGNTSATVTLSDDRVAGDIFTDTYASAFFADAEPGMNKPVTVNGISISGPDAGNYTFNTTATTTASIGIRTLTITATGVNKVYDGTIAATVTLSDNRVPGDVFTTSYASAVFADPNAGTAKLVSVSGISISGPNAGSYTFNTTATTTADIAKAVITVTANNAARVYSYPNPVFTASYSGFKNGETLATSGITGAPSLTTTATPSSAAGTYPITPALGTLAAGNYSFAFVDGTLTIYVNGLVGLDSLSIGATKAIADSFDSGHGGYPSSLGSNALMLSNGPIEINGAKISGNVLSAQGSVTLTSNSQVSGNVTAGTTIVNQGTVGSSTPNHPSAPMVATAVADCGAFSSTPGVSGGKFTYANGDLSIASNSTVSLAAGTYCFHNVTLSGNATVQISGPVVIRLTGILNASGGSWVNTTLVPAHLQIHSSYTGADGVTISGNANAYLTIYAPGTGIKVSGGSPVFGALLGKTLTVTGNSQVHFDVAAPGF